MSTQLGENTPRENTEDGRPSFQLLTIATVPDGSSNQIVIQLDAANKKIMIKKVDATGALVAAAGQIELSLDATLGSDGNHHKVYIQEIAVCDGAGNEKKAMCCISDYY